MTGLGDADWLEADWLVDWLADDDCVTAACAVAAALPSDWCEALVTANSATNSVTLTVATQRRMAAVRRWRAATFGGWVAVLMQGGSPRGLAASCWRPERTLSTVRA